jgi:hypothetical protein
MGTWEHRNIRGSPRSHNSLGIFCWGEIPQNTKRKKKRGFYENKKVKNNNNSERMKK